MSNVVPLQNLYWINKSDSGFFSMISLFYSLFTCCIRYDKLSIVTSNCEHFHSFSFYYTDIIYGFSDKNDTLEGIKPTYM